MTRAFFGVAVAVALVCSTPAVAAEPRAGEVAPITAIIVVDESGSLDESAVRAERNAAALLALSELSPASRFAIAGFGSSNAPGQAAVRMYCNFTTLSSEAAREQVAACAKRVHRRAPSEGNDTDHAAALDAAVAELERRREPGALVIFLLTDGILDVRRSPQYGKTATSRNVEAERLIKEDILPRARKAGIQVWPLGFGAVSRGALEAFARGGAGANARCGGVAEARPHGVVVGDSGEVIVGLLQALARARCARVTETTRGRVDSGKTVTLNVTVPIVATDGAITVTKFDPSFRVSYFDPTGQQAPARGEIAGQEFEVSGQNGPVEALRIRNPKPGVWRVKVTAPSSRPGQTVLATVVWQGAVEGAVTLVPSEPRPGRRDNRVEVRLKTRTGVINDPKALDGIRATAVLQSKATGDLAIPLRDDGASPDARARDGVFSGDFAVPKGAAGACAVVGVVTGAGLASDRRPHFCRFYAAGRPVATFDVEIPAAIEQGGTIAGTIVTTNQRQSSEGRLALIDVAEGALVTVEPSVVPLPNGRFETKFSLRVDEKTPRGELTARLQVVASDGLVIGETPVFTEVTAPPSLLERFWWAAALAAAVSVAGAAFMRVSVARTKRRQDVFGLVAKLLRDGQEINELAAPVRGGRQFPIEVIDDDENPRLRASTNGQATLIVQRAGDHVAIVGPNYQPTDVPYGQAFALNDRLELIIRERAGADSTNGTASATSTGTGDLVTEPPPAAPDDETLL